MAVTVVLNIAVLYATLVEFFPCITSYLMAANDRKCDGLPCSLNIPSRSALCSKWSKTWIEVLVKMTTSLSFVLFIDIGLLNPFLSVHWESWHKARGCKFIRKSLHKPANVFVLAAQPDVLTCLGVNSGMWFHWNLWYFWRFLLKVPTASKTEDVLWWVGV